MVLGLSTGHFLTLFLSFVLLLCVGALFKPLSCLISNTSSI